MRRKRAAKNDGNRGRTAACYVILYNSYYIGLHGYNANDLAQNVSNSTVIEHGMTMSCEAIDRMEHFQYFGPLKVPNSVFFCFLGSAANTTDSQSIVDRTEECPTYQDGELNSALKTDLSQTDS